MRRSTTRKAASAWGAEAVVGREVVISNRLVWNDLRRQGDHSAGGVGVSKVYLSNRSSTDRGCALRGTGTRVGEIASLSLAMTDLARQGLP